MIDTVLVSFIDILGYKEIVDKKINDIEFIHQIEDLMKIGINLISRVKMDQQANQGYLDKIKKALNIRVISDSIIVTLSLSKVTPDNRYKNNENISNYIYAYLSVLSAFCPFFIGKVGHILRGGVSLGPHYENDKDGSLFIFSQGFINAFELEKNQKNKARIAIDEKLMLYLKSLSFSYMDRLFYTSEDGTKCLNLYSFLKLDEESKNIFLDIKTGVTLNIREHFQSQNKGIIKKLQYFVKYHNNEMVKGGEVLRDCIIDAKIFKKASYLVLILRKAETLFKSIWKLSLKRFSDVFRKYLYDIERRKGVICLFKKIARSLVISFIVLVGVFFSIVLFESKVSSLWHPTAWILGTIAFLICLCTFFRPWNITPVVFIAFISLLFVGLGNLWQKENFELRNRPYLQIVDRGINLKLTGKFRTSDTGPNPELTLNSYFINHGPVPASIKDIAIRVHRDSNKLNTGVFVGPFSQDKLKQWKNIDVFPSIGKDIPNVVLWTTYFYFNINDIREAFGLSLSLEDIVKQSVNSKGSGIKDSVYLEGLANQIFSDFYIIIQFEYFALSEEGKGKTPYWYWVVYRYSNGFFSFVESGSQSRIKRP